MIYKPFSLQRIAQNLLMLAKYQALKIHQICIGPGLVNIISSVVVARSDESKEIVPLCRSRGFDNPLRLEIRAKLALSPGRVDVILRIYRTRRNNKVKRSALQTPPDGIEKGKLTIKCAANIVIGNSWSVGRGIVCFRNLVRSLGCQRASGSTCMQTVASQVIHLLFGQNPEFLAF